MKNIIGLILSVLLLLPSLSDASITVSIVRPSGNSGSSVSVIATVISTFSLSTVVATVDGQTASMLYSPTAVPNRYGNSAGWAGTLSLNSLLEGSKTLTVTATDVYGGTGINTVTFTYADLVNI